MADKTLLADVEGYYSGKVDEHGPTAAGVDWNGEESQQLRFAQLLTLCGPERRFSLNDYGCGYGALALYLAGRGYDVDYRGYDISPSMLAHARAALAALPAATLVESEATLPPADFTLASGIFNVKLDADVEAWTEHVLSTLDRLDAISTRGFAFNVLTAYADQDRMRADLYYADPAFLFDHCKRHYSPHVALLHDYGLYEFTILVRRSPKVSA